MIDFRVNLFLHETFCHTESTEITEIAHLAVSRATARQILRKNLTKLIRYALHRFENVFGIEVD